MLRGLLTGLSLYVGVQVLLPPHFVDSKLISLPVVGHVVGTVLPRSETRTAVAAELSEIRDRGHLIIGIKNNRPPLGFVNEAGEISGFEVDIARQLAADLLGDTSAIEFVPLSNVDRLNSVLEERVDIAIAAITLTEPRRRLVSFSDPYYLDGTAFIVSSDIQTLRDLSTHRIGLLNRSSTVAHVRYLFPSVQLVGVSSYREGQSLLERGDVDAYAGDASVLTGWLSTQPALAEYVLLPNLISVEPLAVAIPKGTQYDELRTAINQSIQHWYAEGWLQERADYWNLPSGILPSVRESLSDE